MLNRVTVTELQIEVVIAELREAIKKSRDKHGNGAYASAHETLGILREEYREYEDEVIANDELAQRSELMDVAVVAIFGCASADAEFDARPLPPPVPVSAAEDIPF